MDIGMLLGGRPWRFLMNTTLKTSKFALSALLAGALMLLTPGVTSWLSIAVVAEAAAEVASLAVAAEPVAFGRWRTILFRGRSSGFFWWRTKLFGRVAELFGRRANLFGQRLPQFFGGSRNFSGGARGFRGGGYYRGGRYYGFGYGGYYPYYGGFYGGAYCDPYGYYDAWVIQFPAAARFPTLTATAIESS